MTDIRDAGNHMVVSCKNTLLGMDFDLDVDLVVLPTGVVPTTAKDVVVEFDYRQGPDFPDLQLFDGFADSNYICFPYETRRTGVYAAGCVRQPQTLDACEEDARGAVLKAIQCVEAASHGVAVHPRSGDNSYPVFNFVRCTQCKRCTEECPFGALDDDEKGTPKPNPARCRRCGTCFGACPERVISFANYNIDQIGSMIREVVVPKDFKKEGPRILILACENDAYPALDMAGMRRKAKIDMPVERYSVVRALRAVDRSDIAVLVIDATEGVTEQDTKIAGYVHEAGKGCIIVVNKWDLVEKDSKTSHKFEEDIRRELAFLQYAPILFASALTKQRINRLADMVKFVSEQQHMRVSTSVLNELIEDAQLTNPPPAKGGKLLKIYYMTQASVQPPTFILFVNEPQLMHFSYLRFLENRLRETFGFEGTPIRLILRGKKDGESL